VCKPFSPRELTARIRAVLRRVQGNGHAPSAAPSQTKSAKGSATTSPVEVDESRCQVRYFGEVLPLSRYEFRLLQTFAKYPGRVFSRAPLMEQRRDRPEAAIERT